MNKGADRRRKGGVDGDGGGGGVGGGGVRNWRKGKGSLLRLEVLQKASPSAEGSNNTMSL